TSSLTFTDQLPYTIDQPTSNYRVIRSPRLVPGEPPLPLPQNVAIDVGAVLSKYQPPQATDKQSAPFNYDIVFGPAGGVVGRGAGNDHIILWRSASVSRAETE